MLFLYGSSQSVSQTDNTESSVNPFQIQKFKVLV